MKYREKGFTLIEMGIVLLIAGLILGSLSALFAPYIHYVQKNSTDTRMEKVSNSLALFAQNYGRLPCPADPAAISEPFGAPRRSGSDGSNVAQFDCGNSSESNYVGIIPFRALGLTEDQARDGYGNFFTYAASPTMVQFDATLAGIYDQTNVGNDCMVGDWQVDLGPPHGIQNTNLPKAHLCCAMKTTHAINRDISVLQAKASANQVFVSNHGPGAAGAGTGTGDSTYVADSIIAYVLISHGMNGDGAYMNGGGQRSSTVSPTAEESENRNNDLTFVAENISTSDDDNYFDDIVLWKTNDQLVSQFGNNSCSGP
jgi:prepilin-type N-terminal cleavage/methylation domain-containing protein